MAMLQAFDYHVFLAEMAMFLVAALPAVLVLAARKGEFVFACYRSVLAEVPAALPEGMTMFQSRQTSRRRRPPFSPRPGKATTVLCWRGQRSVAMLCRAAPW
jgi:hypothetical protein